jgi:hypothetical protein
MNQRWRWDNVRMQGLDCVAEMRSPLATCLTWGEWQSRRTWGIKWETRSDHRRVKSMKWQFYRQGPTDPVLNPIAGEFFSSEAVGDSAAALVRESIQNSLDARPGDGDAPVMVRIFLSGGSASISAADAKRWFEGIWPHVEAPRNGLAEAPHSDERCPFILIEDFGTLGLAGDPAAYVIDPSKPNDFLNFFRAFGHSDKGGHSKGSWGVGKTVYPRTSRISSFFGLTVRACDKKQMLLGRAILKYHHCERENFKSDGYYGRVRDDGFVLPSRDPDEIEAFRDTFRLRRESEPGLSVVIPWYIPSGDGAVDHCRVVRAVAEGFFMPILSGDLVVHVEEGGLHTCLDACSLETTVREYRGPWADRMVSIIAMARWWMDQDGTSTVEITAPEPSKAQKWSPDCISPEQVDRLIGLAGEPGPFAVRVPLHIRRKGGAATKAGFTVICESTDDEAGSVLFVRDGLIISDVRPTRTTRGVRAIVVVEDEVLAGFLRDAETPAHTEWNPGTANFKSKYVYGPSGIEFVRAAVPEIFAAIRKSDTTVDPNLTAEHFFIDRSGGQKLSKTSRKKKVVKERPVPKPPRFEISRHEGGFVLRNPPAKAVEEIPFAPFRIRLKAAYDTRKDNPLNSWSVYDFELIKPPLTAESAGVTLLPQPKGNELVVYVAEREFQLVVSGFDTTRDLFVDAKTMRGETDDNP